MKEFCVSVSSGSPQKTRQIAMELGKRLLPGTVLCLKGDLGSGKTVFVQGLAQGLGLNPKEVRSPTFALIQEHRGRISLCHADLYRVHFSEIKKLGLEEYWQNNFFNGEGSGWVVAVEWAEKAGDFIPYGFKEASVFEVQLNVLPKGRREILLRCPPNRKEVLSQWKNLKTKK